MTNVELLTLVIAAVPVPVTLGIYLARVRRHDKAIDELDERVRAVEKVADNTRRIEAHSAELAALDERIRNIEIQTAPLAALNKEIDAIREWKHHEVGPLLRTIAAQVAVLLERTGTGWPPRD